MSAFLDPDRIVLLAPDVESFGGEVALLALLASLVEEGARPVVACDATTGRFETALRRSGVAFEPVAWPQAAVIGRLGRSIALARLLQRHRAGMLHLFGTEGAALARAAAARVGARSIVSVDRLPQPSAGALAVVRGVRAGSLAGFDAIEVPSVHARDRIVGQEGQGAAGRVHVVPRGVRPEHYFREQIGGRRVAALAERWQLAPGRRVALMPAPIVPDAGHLRALAAMAHCGRDDFELLCLGDHERAPRFTRELQRALRTGGLGDRVRFASACDDPPAAFALADVVLFPAPGTSLDPTPVLEAQATGVPVIVTDAGGHGEYLLPGVTGWVVRDGDIEALASALDAALALDGAVRARVAERCRQFVAAHFPLEGTVRARLRVYAALVAGTHPPAASRLAGDAA